LIAYALLGTSRLLVVGPDTATGLISALTVGGIAVQGTAEFNALTSTLAILIGAFFLLFGALRMGWGGCVHPHAGDAGVHRGLGMRHHNRPSTASAGYRGDVRQLFHEALARAAASTGRIASPCADRLAQSRSDDVATPPGTPRAGSLGCRSRRHD